MKEKMYADDDEVLLFNYHHPKVEKVLSLFGFNDVIECGGLHPYQIWTISPKQRLLFYFNARYNVYGVITDEYFVTDLDDVQHHWSDVHEHLDFLPEFDCRIHLFQTTHDDGKYYGDIEDDVVCQWVYSFLHDFQNSQ